MGKFIYVFDARDRDALIKLGYELMVSDDKKNMFIFKNSDVLKFNKSDIAAVESDILVF
jgi:ATP-dependent protease HslVU (ClpYQ) peptidase subunit